MKTITLGDDILDSREIIARIEELEGEREDLAQEVENTDEEGDDRVVAVRELKEWDSDNAEELANWKTIADECEGYGDWAYGETLIKDSYWVEYCEELVKDIGDMPKETPHYIVIDWDATADNLKVDYMGVDAGGFTYYMRS